MSKTILITGATDGIGLETARMLYAQGHHLLLHGRNPIKLEDIRQTLLGSPGSGQVECYLADFSRLSEVEVLAQRILEAHGALDAVINNAGVMWTADAVTDSGLDVRFVVNTLAPYWLTNRLLPRMGPEARVINLSSAAQKPVDLKALAGNVRIADHMSVYAQSKLALTMWTRIMAHVHRERELVLVAVNPGSLLATKMVQEGFGVTGKSLAIGADVVVRAAVSDEFADASGLYFDNDQRTFGPLHPDAMDLNKCMDLVETIESILAREVPMNAAAV